MLSDELIIVWSLKYVFNICPKLVNVVLYPDQCIRTLDKKTYPKVFGLWLY